jgi:hypothetical protein
MISENDKLLAYEQLEGDLVTLSKLVYSHDCPVTEGDIRSASAILRKWLVEKKLSRLCNLLKVQPTFPVANNKGIIEQIKLNDSIVFFITAGIKFNGLPYYFPYHSTNPTTNSLRLYEPVQELVSFNDFLSQKRVFFKSKFYTNEEIIKFVANKLGGVHCDFSKKEGAVPAN